VWLLGFFGVFGVFFAVMFVVPLALFGTRRYLEQAKMAEARLALDSMTSGIVRCASEAGPDGTPRGLPPTSRMIPGQLSAVAGKKYQSSAQDWNDEAFTCASFSMRTPQYFVYQWELLDPEHGMARAFADLDDDGQPDHELQQGVQCTSPGVCSALVLEGEDLAPSSAGNHEFDD
jgi:hypothetical protein